MLKKYFWLINLILVTTLVWICVELALTIISNKLEVPNVLNKTVTFSVRNHSATTPPMSKYNPIIQHNIFNPGVKPVNQSAGTKESEDKAKQQNASLENVENAPPTELRLSLKGTAVLEPPGNSFAIIYDESKREQKLYNLGDPIQDATIRAIYADRVILQRGQKIEALHLDRTKEKKRGIKSRRPRSAKQKSDVVRSSTGDHYVLDRQKVNDLVSNISQFMTQLRVRPHFHQGTPVGYRISDIKRGSLMEQIGIQNGDIIKSVNGLPIAKPDQAFEAYQQLMEESQITLELQRGRENQIITYELK